MCCIVLLVVTGEAWVAAMQRSASDAMVQLVQDVVWDNTCTPRYFQAWVALDRSLQAAAEDASCHHHTAVGVAIVFHAVLSVCWLA